MKCRVVFGLVAWHSGNTLCLINEVALNWAGLLIGQLADHLQVVKPSWYVTGHLGQLSLPSLWGR